MSMLLHSATFPHLVCRRKTLPTKSQKLLESHDHVWQPPLQTVCLNVQMLIHMAMGQSPGTYWTSK
jgi:hypothetical protein